MSAHHQNASRAALPSLNESPAEERKGGMVEGGQRGIERKDHGQIEIVLSIAQRLDTQA
jgi:hypothetical protein